MNIISILVIAFLVEAIVETVKFFKGPNGIDKNKLGALIVGEVMAFASFINIFTIIGIPLNFGGLVPEIVGIILGIAFTGLLMSRGANFVHDLLAGISNIKDRGQPNTSTEAKDKEAAIAVYSKTTQFNPSADEATHIK
jgi:hypothetical protein